MFDDISYTEDPVNAFEERRLLRQIISTGVGYPFDRPYCSKAAIVNENWLHPHISRIVGSERYSDQDSKIREINEHIQRGDDGYYLLDLYKGRILAKKRLSIEDILIDFKMSESNNNVLLRRRKCDYLRGTAFLVATDAVYFLWMDKFYIPLGEFHMLSFIRTDDGSRAGLVMDYDAAQNNRPMVLFPCEENHDIIESQLENEDRLWAEEYNLLFGDIDFKRKKKK